MTSVQAKINQPTFQATKINKPDNKPENKAQTGMSTTTKVLVGATALAAVVIAGIALKGKIKSKNLQSVQQAVSNVSEKVLSNGKKITKTVEKTKDGAEKVIINIFDDKGVLQVTREKIITRGVNPKNGRKYITIDKKYTSPLEEACCVDILTFLKNGNTQTKKYYSSEGKKFFETFEYKLDTFKDPERQKIRKFIRPDGTEKISVTTFTHAGRPNIRSCRFDLKGNGSKVKFNENGVLPSKKSEL